MFSSNDDKAPSTIVPDEVNTPKTNNKNIKNTVQVGGNYYSMYNDDSLNKNSYVDMNPQNIDELLENEKKSNKKESWNKLDNTLKIDKLHNFANSYGEKNNYAMIEIKTLKKFFSTAVRSNKLKKTKDVLYNKDTGIVTDVPSLFFSKISRKFTLKNLDSKRVSTLKSLTPKRTSNKNKVNIVNDDKIE